MTPAHITLGGYPAKQCPRLVHNNHVPGLARPPVTDDMTRLFDEGVVFERVVTVALAQALGDDVLVIDDSNGTWGESVRATIRAMERGVPAVVNGRLPDVEGRAGAPDVLVLADDGYLPIDIKNHKTFSSATKSGAEVSALASPLDRHLHAGPSNLGTHWRDDCLQLAHYTRMLQALGYHPGGRTDEGNPWLIGGIIGTSDFAEVHGEPYGISWYDLSAEREVTFSTSDDTRRKKRSPLARYDHEFAFRVRVAEAASRGDELVRPLHTDECDSCVWLQHCREIAGAEDASFAIKAGRLTAREWLYLYDRGGDTLQGLADLDVTDLSDGFAEHAAGRVKPQERLRKVVRRAQMTLDGTSIEPLAEWPAVPSADVEVDFDIEWDCEGRIYLWGLRVRDGSTDSTSAYEPVASFESLTDDGEEVLAEELAQRLEDLVRKAEEAGKGLTIFHWHHVERSRTKRFPRVAALLEGRTIDLMAWFDQHFFSVEGSSIKKVATALGFQWTVEDPGGFASMTYAEKARGDGPEAAAAQRWLLDYNESDVAAQAAIRDALRAYSGVDNRVHDTGSGPAVSTPGTSRA